MLGTPSDTHKPSGSAAFVRSSHPIPGKDHPSVSSLSSRIIVSIMIGVVKSLLAASVLGLAAAAPYNEVKPGSFKVVQQRNPNYDNSTFVPRGALAMYKAYMKYGAPVPDAINKTVTEYRAAKQARRLAKRDGTVTVSCPVWWRFLHGKFGNAQLTSR